VNKCDKKIRKLPLTPDDPWRGLGTETPPTTAHWFIKSPPKSNFFKQNAINPT
jgi:hypothetical protein